AEILMRFYGRAGTISKKGEIDLVTDADIGSESKILEIIGKYFPGDSILSEEAGPREEDSSRKWIVDPLDGTTNFAHGFPFFSVSIALQAEGDTVMGVVYNPFMNEFFEAVKGRGSFLNKNRIHVSKIDDMGESLLATGFPYNIRENPSEIVDLFERMLVRSQGVRRPGCASIDLCYVAAGRLDGFWEQGLKPWDTAAGMLIVEEAGGRVTTYDGKPYSPFLKNIVASNGCIHNELVAVTSDGS
ncbi:inositol monophosphatase family protein, partial [Thermodesulfobacteriota bacterium]